MYVRLYCVPADVTNGDFVDRLELTWSSQIFSVLFGVSFGRRKIDPHGGQPALLGEVVIAVNEFTLSIVKVSVLGQKVALGKTSFLEQRPISVRGRLGVAEAKVGLGRKTTRKIDSGD
jgi:hypothetical protein